MSSKMQTQCANKHCIKKM